MKINRLVNTINCNVRTGRSVEYIVIHYVGALGGAEDNCRYYASRYVGASAHYFVGHDGEIWQSVEEKDIAWHCGAKNYNHPDCRNSNSIGVELCVRKRDTSSMGAGDTDWYFEPATVAAAQELVRDLMARYSISLDHVLRHYDVTGKCCPNPYVMDGSLWEEFKAGLLSDAGLTPVCGATQATAEQMAAYLVKKNPDTAPYALEHARLYLSEGAKEGIRGDVAWAQRCLETGHDTYEGSAVTLDQHNYGGFGVTKKGMKGESFPDAAMGILVHIQHLKAYANSDPLAVPCVDPRFVYVRRGCSPYVEWLGQQENPANEGKPKKEWGGWAAGKDYGSKILAILKRILSVTKEEEGILQGQEIPQSPSEQEPPVIEPDVPVGSYLIMTTVDSLRIRRGPGMEYPVVGGINETAGKKKKYTIVEERNGWGRLKSGAGWIYLWYTRRA